MQVGSAVGAAEAASPGAAAAAAVPRRAELHTGKNRLDPFPPSLARTSRREGGSVFSPNVS